MPPSERDRKKWLSRALRLAQKATLEDEVPVGAIVVHDGKILGKGYNKREPDHKPLAHAELIALRQASRTLKSWRLIDCTLIVTLEPCPMCLAACHQARVQNVIYGAIDKKGGALSLGYLLHEDARTNHRFTVAHHEDAQCGSILTEFFRNKRQKAKRS